MVHGVERRGQVDRRMRTDERDKALAARSDSVTTRRAVSVESAVFKPDW